MRPLALLVALPLLGACDAGSSGVPGTCAGVTAYAIGSIALDTLGRNECERPGDTDGHLYGIVLAAQSNFALTLTPSGFNSVLALYDSTDRLIWSSTDEGVNRFKVYLPPGAYLAVAARQGHAGGEYTLTSPAAEQNSCLPHGIVVKGSVVAGSLTGTDCADGLAGWVNDVYAIHLAAGQAITWAWSMNQAGRAEVYLEGSVAQVDARNFAANAATTIPFTATTAGWYRIHLASNIQPASYTLSFQ